MTPVADYFAPVREDLRNLTANLKNLIGAKHPILYAAAEHLFEGKGKGLRPALVFLAARATMPGGDITPRHSRLAEITEMIHTASLVHDDVIDEAEVRRNLPTVNHHFGNRVAVLAGDFLFAQSSWYLANLDNLEVVKLLARVIADFAEGEILQSLTAYDPTLTFEDYLQKSFYKTASLMAGSMKAAAVLSDLPAGQCDRLYEFGKHFGIAFQIVDDILDFTGSTESLGKPAGSDLKQGNLTAPVLYALVDDAELAARIGEGLTTPEDIAFALERVRRSGGIERSRELARSHSCLAAEALAWLPPSPCKDSLLGLTEFILERLY